MIIPGLVEGGGIGLIQAVVSGVICFVGITYSGKKIGAFHD